MDRSASASVLREFTDQQHLYPHQQTLRAALTVCQRLEVPAFVAEQAVTALSVGAHTSIGRLSRRQVQELARLIEATCEAQMTLCPLTIGSAA